ncbi:hypothetical protein STCU_00586 [Strigomonas culicis]|uniref:Uncharacterized protein n=1 Tax=Strigomonas culicis TaxID=28005 RepID=S9V5T4_9TRYP|nr:hypothetical protein STCU_00586 [Strigomonas culicis]|eukprot:EPY36434.1 hypothetical protein STCU_00586 [Strigomonas culicis]
MPASMLLGCPQVRLLAASLSGGLGVVMGALGAHAFLDLMSQEELKLYQDANQGHLIHSVILYLIGFVLVQRERAVGSDAAAAAKLGYLRLSYDALFLGMSGLALSRYVHCTVHKPDWLPRIVLPASHVLLTVGWGLLTVYALM